MMLTQTKKHRRITDHFNASQNGQSLVEYTLILLLVAAVATAGLALTGSSVSDVYARIVAAMNSETEENPGHIVVSVEDNSGGGIANARVYMFNEKGQYQGRYGSTDQQGNLAFEEVADGRYKFRADYQTKQYWSQTIAWPSEWHAIIETGQRPFTITVVDNGGSGIGNVRVYAFNENGGYTGVYGSTNENGQLALNLADGSYKFRADYQTRQYWSDVVESPDKTEAIVQTGQRPFTINVVDDEGSGIGNVRVYAFNENGGYTGVYGSTNESGQLALNLADGSYKFRADYQTYQYWSDVVRSPDVTEATVKTGQQDFTVHVITDSGTGIASVRVYAFNENGGYAGVYGNTDGAGQVVLNLGQGNWKFRADYQTRQFWSDVVNLPASTETIVKTGERPFTIHVVNNEGNVMANVRVYAFNEKGGYLGVYGNTDTNGKLNLNLADGDLKFRADYGGSQYWSPLAISPDTTTATVTIQN
jgi:Flp pilus assembly pilin Flp/uncharacterized GH25 family protein